MSHIRIIGSRKVDENDGNDTVRYSASEDRSYNSVQEVVLDLAEPLRLLHPATGSPYLPLFGGSVLKGSGGYEAIVRVN